MVESKNQPQQQNTKGSNTLLQKLFRKGNELSSLIDTNLNQMDELSVKIFQSVSPKVKKPAQIKHDGDNESFSTAASKNETKVKSNQKKLRKLRSRSQVEKRNRRKTLQQLQSQSDLHVVQEKAKQHSHYHITSHTDEWEKIYMKYSPSENSSDWELQQEFPEIQEEIVESINEQTLSNGQSRVVAWSLLLGIRNHDVITQYKFLYYDLLAEASDLEKNTENDAQQQKQIKFDVLRSFSQFKTSMDDGENSLYNVLTAYAKHNPEVGYCQGMNYLVGLILIGVNYDEVTTFMILERLMGKYELSSLYGKELSKLFSLSDIIQKWMAEVEPELQQLITNHGVPMTSLLAGPFMATFANILSIDTCLLIVDRLILLKEIALLDIVMHVFRQMKDRLFSKFSQQSPLSSDSNNDIACATQPSFDNRDKSEYLQVYLMKLIYIEAEQKDKLLPDLEGSY